MNLISNIETSSTNSAWNQPPTSNGTQRSQWDQVLDSTSTNDTNSQWLNQNSAQQVTNSSQQQTQSQQSNQSGELDTSSSLPKTAWSHIVDTSNNNAQSTQVNQNNSPAQLDSPTQSNDYSSSAISELKGSIKDDKFTNAELYSDNWGNIPINQNTPWELPQSQNYQQSPREVHSCNGLIDNSWKYSSSTTGTDIWEANFRKKSTDQSPTGDLNNAKQTPNWPSSTNAVQMTNHIGGVWGECEEDANTNQNNNWMNDKQWNKQWNEQGEDKLAQMNKGMNDTLFSTWNSNSTKENAWQDNDGMMNEDGDSLGTQMWRKQNGAQNTRWKDPMHDQSNDLLFNKMNNNKMNMNVNMNMTNQTCANNLNSPMQNGFSNTASPGVLRIPSSVNSMTNQNKVDQWNKVQTMQPNNSISKQPWLDQNSVGGNNFLGNLNAIANNGQQQAQHQQQQLQNGVGSQFWNSAADQSVTANAQLNWNKGQQQMNNNNNNDDWNSELKKEMIMQSHQFKVLADRGFRKENIEVALRNSNMNLKDAIDELRADVLKETSNDLDKRKNSFNPSSLPPNSSINNRNTSQFNNQISQISQPNQMFRNNNNNSNINLNNNNNNNTKTPNTAMLQDKRLGNLVQQIQLAVHSGHLNAQILNQPLSHNTIQLIYQLLQEIRNLHTLQLQSRLNMNKNLGPAQSDLNVQITMIKQRISSLQNQIKVQQQIFINNQQQTKSVPNSDLNNLNNLANNGGLSINSNAMSDFNKLISSPESPNEEFQSNSGQQQSRLSTWKNSTSSNDGFSRAPGSLNKTGANNWPLSSEFQNNSETWLNEANDLTNTLSNMNLQQSQQTFNITDSVPEFEPGKPWRGSAQMKSSDDDPHLTPGSVNRSILSLNNFNNWQTKPATTTVAPTSNVNANPWNGALNNDNSSSPNWNGFNSNESSTSPVENLWQNKIKGPPPGLSPNKEKQLKSNYSTYLLIKNLTPQIDASTLRTLCLQHGPLQMFNLMNNGVALVKYKSREEAMKAQSALNNCYLSNTPIYVDLIAENEVQHYISGQQTNNNSNMNSWNSNNQPNGVYRNNSQTMINSNNNPWRNNQQLNDNPWSNGSNLWNNSLDASSMPINLLPGDLLNGESA